MMHRAQTGWLSVAVAWVLWVYTDQSVGNHRSPGTWTELLRTEQESVCERKKAEQVRALLNTLMKFGATVDPAGETVFHATRSADGRPIMKRTRYRCLPESTDPRHADP